MILISKIKENPCLYSTNYGANKKYAQELFYINDKSNMSFDDNINNINQIFTKPRQPLIKKVLRKIKRMIFR